MLHHTARKIVAGTLLAALTLMSSAAVALEFRTPQHLQDEEIFRVTEGDPFRIYATGDIVDSDAAQLAALAKKIRVDHAIVVFDSPGGSVLGSLALGEKIRELGFATGVGQFKDGRLILNGVCASACAYAFAGGAGRYITSPKSRLGLHQFHSKTSAISNERSQAMSGMLVAYLQKMGIDALAFSVSAIAGPDDMVWLTPADARKLNFANNGVLPSNAELKQADGITYLRIEQIRDKATGRFIFHCIKGQIMVMGGLVTSEKVTRQRDEWITRSALLFDDEWVRLESRKDNPKGVSNREKTSWVIRNLTPEETRQLLKTDTLGMSVASDGASAFGAYADLREVRPYLTDFVKNCRP